MGAMAPVSVFRMFAISSHFRNVFFLTALILSSLGGLARAEEIPGICQVLLGALGEMSPDTRLKMAALLKDFSGATEDVAELQKLLAEVSSGRVSMKDAKIKTAMLDFGEKLYATGHLPEILQLLAQQALEAGKLPAQITKENLPGYLIKMHGVIEGELSARGRTKTSAGAQYEEWSDLGRRMMGEIRARTEPLRTRFPKRSLFEIPEFVNWFESSTHSKFLNGTRAELLVDGPASFGERKKLIEEARTSIHIMSWAWYDDNTGKSFSSLLIEKKRTNPSIDIRIRVDGQTSRDPDKQAMLAEMEKAGIEVLRWMSPDSARPIDGMHRKVMVVDGKTVIAGGMNFGDEYSHLGPLQSPKWRDTDVKVTGSGVEQFADLFLHEWNDQLNRRPELTRQHLTALTPSPPQGTAMTKGMRGALINHRPGEDNNIYLANLLAIEAAVNSISIENAYVLLDPGTLEAVLRAKKRGVRVRVLTNSFESVDVPEIAHAMMLSANRLAKHGVEVYLKKGDTLHAKGMSVDGIYSYVASHNLHGRSVRYEGEVLYGVLDKEFGAKFERMLEKDFAAAQKLEGPLPIPPNRAAEFFSYWFFDQL